MAPRGEHSSSRHRGGCEFERPRDARRLAGRRIFFVDKTTLGFSDGTEAGTTQRTSFRPASRCNQWRVHRDERAGAPLQQRHGRRNHRDRERHTENSLAHAERSERHLQRNQRHIGPSSHGSATARKRAPRFWPTSARRSATAPAWMEAADANVFIAHGSKLLRSDGTRNDRGRHACDDHALQRPARSPRHRRKGTCRPRRSASGRATARCSARASSKRRVSGRWTRCTCRIRRSRRAPTRSERPIHHCARLARRSAARTCSGECILKCKHRR